MARVPNRVKIPVVLVVVALFVGVQIYIVSQLDISSVTDRSFETFSRSRRLKPSPPATPIAPTRNHNMARRRKFIPIPHQDLNATQISRQDAIRRAMQHAWTGYETRAFGADEVAPVSGLPRPNVWGGIGVTLVDSLDTLYIMGMQDEFERCRYWVANELDFSHLGQDGTMISVFEVIIRELGGLLSAYDLSQDDVFKHRAVELADLLLPAFDDQVFYTKFNVFTQRRTMNHWTRYRAFLADVGTLQLEMRYLTDVTGNAEYAEKGDAFYDVIQREGSYKRTGLFPVHFEPDSGTFSRSDTFVTIGALGDSFYEYLLKVWLYSGKRSEDEFLRRLYDDAVDGMEKHLFVHSLPDDAYFLQELRIPQMEGTPQQDHLLCFVPGMLALGTVGETDAHKVDKHLDMAKKLMHTCVSYYTRQPTGLAPDLVHFPGFDVQNSIYKLRPETVESLMYLFRITQDPIYREWGWTIFESLEQHAKTTYGYGAVRNVHDLSVSYVEDKMESFFLAETLKYHYLLQSAPSFLPLDQFVFNTEAHPFRIATV
ncbi:hypothetical protein H310_04186 [Aphanomyces invadans]|uniref:alpha-1,2-Mannosidase n=1 Tax=Aphanomyces invadans TaxID=157072 RepID=A0A024UHT9_9STRA|nr:hypothetical protein H310_04186 [Aphanomyces invadans]ETW05193.1 hypothetical protein H310_04186 [Aphanomyces invadans]|eukprot:XP_008866631.1 hypothetical protein H310_04186 [Aphanomyces invadans]